MPRFRVRGVGEGTRYGCVYPYTVALHSKSDFPDQVVDFRAGSLHLKDIDKEIVGNLHDLVALD